MKKVKILHCGDLHFDTPFKELNNKLSWKCKEELLEVFKKIIDLVISENVQILLIAGDIFDNLSVNKETISFIANNLKRIENVRVFISPGNHDPYNNKSFYKIIEWPENVYIFKSKMESVEIKELDTVIWGAAFNESYEKQTLLENISIDNSKINIAVLHGEIESLNASNNYNPIYLEDIEKSKIDYIALGHRHKFSSIKRVGTSYYSYSGCPQGRGFDELGEKGVVIGEVFKGGNSLKFVNTAKRKYYIEEIDVSGADNYEQIIKKILNVCKDKIRSNFYKIILRGELEEHFNLNEDILLNRLEDEFYYIKIVNSTSVKVDLKELVRDYSLKSKFILNMINIIKENEDEDKDIYNLALKLGIQCLSEEEVNLNDN